MKREFRSDTIKIVISMLVAAEALVGAGVGLGNYITLRHNTPFELQFRREPILNRLWEPHKRQKGQEQNNREGANAALAHFNEHQLPHYAETYHVPKVRIL